MEKYPPTRPGYYNTPDQTRPFFGNTASYDDPFFKGQEGDEYVKAAGTPEVKKAPAAPVDLSPEKGKELRAELAKLFEAFNGKVVGDKEFDDIIKEKSWDDRKTSEKTLKEKNDADLKKYETSMAEWSATDASARGDKPVKPVPEPVRVYTTCIDTQRKVLEKALEASHTEAKKVSEYDNNGFKKKNGKKAKSYAYGSLGPQQAKELGAWQEASPKMKERPQPGDILVLAFRGKAVDKAATEVAGMESFIQKSKDTEAAAANFLAQANEAKAAVEAAQASDDPALIKAAKAKVIAVNNTYAVALQKAKSAAKNAQGSVAALPKTYEKLDKARAEANHERFQFSHVGFFVSLETKPDGTEIWTTFDGGQTLDAKGGKKQGASMNKRIYRPDLNEIAGEKSQDGSARWLQGWTNVEKIAQMQPPETAD